MKRVGGYADLLALEGDGMRYDDVLIIIEGENEARAIEKMLAEIEAEKSGADI